LEGARRSWVGVRNTEYLQRVECLTTTRHLLLYWSRIETEKAWKKVKVQGKRSKCKLETSTLKVSNKVRHPRRDWLFVTTYQQELWDQFRSEKKKEDLLCLLTWRRKRYWDYIKIALNWLKFRKICNLARFSDLKNTVENQRNQFLIVKRIILYNLLIISNLNSLLLANQDWRWR
jgi:hypothetical protein